MPGINDHIGIVQEKLHLLLRRYEQLVKETEQQKLVIHSLQEQVTIAREQVEALQQQQLILKASLTEMEPADKKELEQKLNHYIRNIDKCISLLSQ